MNKYFILVEEWNYPTESGREPIDVTFDENEKEDAIAYAHMKVCDEVDNFGKVTNMDIGHTDMFDDNSGYIVTTKMGLDPYYYAVRLILVEPIDSNLVRDPFSSMNKK